MNDNDKKEWLEEYTNNIIDPNWREKRDEWLKTNTPGEIDWDTPLLPIAMKVAAQTIGMDLVSVQPLSAPTSSAPELNEEKYLNERRKQILDDILDGEDIDFDDIDKVKETNFEVTEQTAIERNAKRASEGGRNVPTHVIQAMLAKYQTPSQGEGFDEVKFISKL